MSAGRTAGVCVVVGGTAWDGNKFPDQHMAERLAEHVAVLYVDPCVSILRSGGSLRSAWAPAVVELMPNLFRVTPVAPPGVSRVGLRSLAALAQRRAIVRSVRAMDTEVRAVVVASLAPVLDLFPSATNVLYGTDDFVAGAELMGLGVKRVRRQEARRLAEADLVVAVSEHLAETWRGRGAHPVVIANGCDDTLFGATADATPPADVTLPRPIAGFIGHLSERIDVPLLEAVADRGRSLLLVGPHQHTFDMARMRRLLALPNVQWVGARPFATLPSYLSVMDVGLLPYTDTEFNRASFPLKVLEYLAGGRPAVATDLPAVRWLDTDLIEVATGPEQFADAVDAVLARPADGILSARRRDFAAQHSWAARATALAELMGLRAGSAAASER